MIFSHKHELLQYNKEHLQYNVESLQFNKQLLVKYEEAIQDERKESKFLKLKMLTKLASRPLKNESEANEVNEQSEAPIKRKQYARISEEQKSTIK
jgi:hypothetical protein